MFKPGATGQGVDLWGRVFDITSLAGPLLLGGASLVGGALSANAAGNAADTQSAAGRYAADLANNQRLQTREDLSPFRTGGAGAFNALTSRLPQLTSPITMTQADLEATPGYQFTRDQGLKSVQSAAAARGLGMSGAALKGAARFATGLADNTYQNRFANELASRQNAYSDLMGASSLGENAAAMTGTLGNASTAAQGNALMSGAASSAAGDVGTANALSNALTGGANNVLNYSLLQKLLANSSGGGSTAKSGY